MHVLTNRDWNPFRKRRRSESKCRESPPCEDYSRNFAGLGSFAATKREVAGANLAAGGRDSQEYHFFSIEGGYMKRAILAVVLLTVVCFSSPASAQQQDLQEVMDATNALGARESEFLNKKDAAGIASLFTSDGLLVMLAPQFAFKPGRDAIQKHYQGIIDAGAAGITLELKNLELRGNDGVWAAGNYSITVKEKTIQGNWFRILKRENGTWKIAMEAFARAGAIDVPPAAVGSSPAPTNSK
jgi:uncharacterized protein (TIGR02246 family)